MCYVEQSSSGYVLKWKKSNKNGLLIENDQSIIVDRKNTKSIPYTEL